MGVSATSLVVNRFLDHEGPALIDAHGELSYSQLRALVAARSREFDEAAPGLVVPVRQADTRAFLIDAFAVWSRGAALFPVDSKAPEAAVAPLLARLQPVPEQVMLVLATSGSSGPPKLVLLGCSGLLHNVDAILDYLPVAQASRIGLCSPLTYSYGLVGQALTCLRAGACLVDLSCSAYAEEQIKLARAHDVHGVSSVPTHLRRWVRLLEEQQQTLPLRFVASAGAHLDVETALRMKQVFSAAELFRQYGLTEYSPRVAAISSTDPGFDLGATGYPVRGTECRVLDEHATPVTANVDGELWVRGPSTMLGYLGEPQSTANVLSGDGWLKTGDSARIDEHGRLYISGRRDGVVKCAGERVSTEEVAEVIRGISGVRDAVVIAISHRELGAELCAFVEADESLRGLIRTALRERLTLAKRPSAISFMAEIPRTSNGKWALAELTALAQRKTT